MFITYNLTVTYRTILIPHIRVKIKLLLNLSTWGCSRDWVSSASSMSHKHVSIGLPDCSWLVPVGQELVELKWKITTKLKPSKPTIGGKYHGRKLYGFLSFFPFIKIYQAIQVGIWTAEATQSKPLRSRRSCHWHQGMLSPQLGPHLGRSYP